MYTVEFLPLETSEPGRFPLTSAACWTGRSDRISFHSSVQLFPLFTASKLSCDRCYRTAPRGVQGFLPDRNSRGPRNLQLATFRAKSFRCHTSEKYARNSFGCHTYKIASS